ncbi:glycerate kinase [Rubrolithibacter danxiaensis]|uniref:glycerate kinase n=1 Tax=Rubrolithibacter danxiaensis TaxID=3390805 RepID=UPI003BF7880D
MKVVVAADKFKDSLNSFEVCEAVSRGFSKSSGNFEIFKMPLSDGGDGLIEVIRHYISVTKHEFLVSDPLFRPIKASVLLSEDRKTAFMEMAQASGLHLLKPSEYNCAVTSSFGTGQLIAEALKLGVEKIIIGVGGSATNDCGIGMAAAVGYRFLNKDGKDIKPIGENLINIDSIDSSEKIPLSNLCIEVACDVINPLTGENGASRVYAPQKGADRQLVEELERGMIHFSEVLKRDLGTDISSVPGAGAAGGMGAGCMAFLNAKLISGSELVFQYSEAEKHIKDADIVITAEGKIDKQTLEGKLISEISGLCLKYNKPLIAICGSLDLTCEELKKLKVLSAFSIVNRPMLLEEAIEKASELVSETAFNIAQVLGSNYNK